MILSFPIFPDARSPRANADAIFPAPIKPTDDILRDMTSIKFCIDDVSVMIVILISFVFRLLLTGMLLPRGLCTQWFLLPF